MSDHVSTAHVHGKDHVPHILPLSTYLKTWGALMVLTVLTLAASYVSFGAGNLVIAMAIATVKASIVALVFMHLYFDNKFHAAILLSAFVFLGIFISFTMLDTETRGRADAMEAEHPANLSNPFGGTASEKATKERLQQSLVRPTPGGR